MTRASTEPIPNAARPRVLLVDDHQLLRQAVRRALEDAGMEVVAEAGDGSEAVRLAAEIAPDVIVMDVSMPVLDGVEATRRIHAVTPDLPIVVLTMHGEASQRQEALEAGATGFLTKDVSMQDVVRTVHQAVGGDVALSPELASTILDELRIPDTRNSSPLTPTRGSAAAHRRRLEYHRGRRAAVHQRQDREEPPRLDLREARRS